MSFLGRKTDEKTDEYFKRSSRALRLKLLLSVALGIYFIPVLLAETPSQKPLAPRRLVCSSHLKELGFIAGPRLPAQEGRELVLAKIELTESTPLARTFSSDHLAVLLEPVPQALLPKPGKLLIIETVLESNRGMIDSIFATFSSETGDPMANVRFDARGRYVSGISLLAADQRTSGPVLPLGPQSSTPHPLEALVPRALIRPLHHKIHPKSPEDPQEIQMIFTVRRSIDSEGNEQVELSLSKALLTGILTERGVEPILSTNNTPIRGLSWEVIPLFQDERASPTNAVPRPQYFVDNADPHSTFEFEMAVHPRRLHKQEAIDHSILFSVNYRENADPQKQLVFDLEQDADGFHYQIYEEDLSMSGDNTSALSENRSNPRFRSVGFTNSRADALFYPQEVIWTDSSAEEEFRLGLRSIVREIALGVDSIHRRP